MLITDRLGKHYYYKKMETKQDAQDQMRRIIQELLPDIIREQVNTVRTGKILSIGLSTRSADIQLIGTGKILNNVKLSKGLTDVVVGDTCVVVSDDPILSGNNYILGVL